MKAVPTVAVGPPGDLPQHQAEGPDVHPLVGVEAVRLDAVVQHLGGHVALGAHLGVVPHVQQVVRLGVGHGQPCGEGGPGVQYSSRFFIKSIFI